MVFTFCQSVRRPWRQDSAVVDSIDWHYWIRVLRTGRAHCARLHSGNRPAV